MPLLKNWKMKINNDILKSLIRQLPDEQLPENFNEQLMQKLLVEKTQRAKRSNMITIGIITAISFVMIALLFFTIRYLEISINLKDLDFEMMPFYGYIGILFLLLLIADHKLRQIYKKKHSDF